MKRNLFILLGLVIMMAACDETSTDPVIKGCTNPAALNYDSKATEDDGSCIAPMQKQFGFAINYTATWCGPCGSWGAPKIHELAEAGDVVAITAHASNDPMHVPTLYSGFASCRPTGGGIPSFWVGDTDDGEVSDMNTLLAQTPDVGLTFVNAMVNGKMRVRTKVQFFENVSGSYYLSVYILEDGIDGSASAGEYAQNGASDPNYKHDFVIRAAAGDMAYGEMIASGSIAKGTSVEKTYDLTIDPSWVNDVYVAACIWRYDSGTGFYHFENAFKK